MDAFAWEVIGSVAGVVAAAAAIIALVPVLRAHRQVTQLPDADRDGALPAGAGEDVPVVAGEIPRAPLGFQPRADLMLMLEPGARSRVVVVQAVTGMRGVGKTHLAAAYARARLTQRWRLVAWINAEDLGGILAGLADVAAGLGLGAQVDVAGAGRAVRHWLEAGGDRCLLVFDNATDPDALEPFLPAAGASQVIITSNLQAVANLGAAVPVDVFSEPEALAFLAGRTGSADTEGARALAAGLGYLPLALAQAAAVISDQHLGYGNYLDRLRDMPVSKLLKPVEAGQYPRGVAAAVLLSLEGVQARDDSGACTAVMELLAVLSPAGVRRTLLQHAASQGALGRAAQAGGLGSDVADQALGQLAGASLLTFSVDGSSVTTHRLVMRVIRENLAATSSLTATCQAAADLLHGQITSIDQSWYQDRAATRDLIEQILALNETAACPPGSDLNYRMIELRGRALWFLNELEDSAAQAIAVAEQLIPDQEQAFGPDHPGTLLARNELAVAYWMAGRTDEAIALNEQTLVTRERVLGPDHPDTSQSRSNLAIVYEAAGRTDEAIALFEQALATRERVLGPDHYDTLTSRNNLASAYHSVSRTDEAITLNEESLAAGERLGPGNPLTLDARHNLAECYQTAGRIDEAITLNEENMAACERFMGPDHPHTLLSRGNLAGCYQAAGRIDEAITLYEQALAASRRVLGPDHPDTLALRKGLARAYDEAGRPGETAKLSP